VKGVERGAVSVAQHRHQEPDGRDCEQQRGQAEREAALAGGGGIEKHLWTSVCWWRRPTPWVRP